MSEKSELECLIEAVYDGNLAVVERLIQGGIDVNAVDPRGNFPLLAAAEQGHVLIVRALLAAGANVNQRDDSPGFTPLMRAASYGHIEVVVMLIDTGADVNATLDECPLNPLTYAQEGGHEEIVKLLREAGARNVAGAELKKQRGAIPFDRNLSLLLAKAPVNKVAQAFRSAFNVEVWHKNVLCKEVTIVDPSFLIFQLSGHKWTNVLGLSTDSFYWFKPDKANRLSKTLEGPVIYFGVSDTAEAVAYSLFDNGKLVEELDFSEVVFSDLGDTKGHKFVSKLRKTKANEIKNVEAFVDDFFRDQDALVPPVGRSSYNIGEKVVIDIAGLDPEDVARMDFVGGGEKPPSHDHINPFKRRKS
jgi:hypothetical protein